MPTLAYTGKQSTGSKECGAYALTACLLALRKIPAQTTSLTYILPTVETQSGDTMDSGKVIMRTANVPPSAVTRSRIPVRPKPCCPESGGKPLPSSSITSINRSSCCQPCRVTALASACRTKDKYRI